MSTSNCRIAGLLAVLAAILLSIADISFLYSPKGGYESEEMLFLLDIPLWRLKLGHFLGVFILPFYLFGYWIVYRALKPAGRWFSLPIFWIITYGVIVGAVLHGSIAMYAILMQEHEAAANVETGRVLFQLMEISLDLFEPFQATAFLCFGLTAIWYFVAVFFKQTLLPRWMAFLNTILLHAPIVAAYFLIPSLGNILMPAAMNIAHVVFFFLITIHTWNKSDRL